MFTAALFTVARKQPTCPLTDEWIIKTRYVHTVEFYPALERKEILTHPSTWRKPENIMLSETKGQILCDSTYMSYLE